MTKKRILKLEALSTAEQVGEPKPRSEMRDIVLTEAKHQFRKSGFSAVSINDIVQAVGITKPTLYYYFKDKENLYSEVMIDMMRHGNEFVEEGIRHVPTTKEKLEVLTEGFMEHSPTCMMAMMRDAMEHLSELHIKKVKDAYKYYMVSTFESLFQEGITRGEVVEKDPKELAIIFVGLLDSYTINQTALSGRKFNFKEKAKELVNVLMNGIAT
ncbi:MAG: TetR/AcrR family transcriptional regulator [Vampirovibrio sp.]|nr:TetR/AcrR family transcriptional regulator [Vampirovibrio sp.]